MKNKKTRMLIFGLMAIFFIFCGQEAKSQDVQKIKDMDLRGSPPDSIIMVSSKIIDFERKKSKPDEVLLGSCLYFRAKAEYDLKEALPAYTDAVESLKLLSSKRLESTFSVIDLLNNCYGLIVANDLALEPLSGKQTKEESIFFSILQVVNNSGDTVIVKINGGSNEGVKLNNMGGVLSAFSAEDTTRGNDELGNCRVIEVHPTWSLAEIVVFERSRQKKLTPMAGDNLMLKIQVPLDVYRGDLFNLAAQNIFLFSNKRYQIYRHSLLLRDQTAATEKAILLYMLNDELETAEYLYDTTTRADDPGYPPYTKGPNKGLNMWQAMLHSNVEDVKAYARFVNSFPAKYMGRSFRFDETFATWLNNHSPPGTAEAEYAYHRIGAADTSIAGMKKLASQLKYYLGYYDPSVVENSSEHWESVVSQWRDLNKKYIDKSEFQAALTHTDKLISFAIWFENDTFLMPLLFEKAFLHQKLKQFEEARKIYERTLSFQILPYQSYWFRANLFYEQERYREAMEDFAKVSELAPWSSSPLGMQGWILLKTGKFNPAFDFCKKAYEMDTFNNSWTVNYGHAWLMKGDIEKARYYYDKSLALIELSSEFYTGLIADFDTFLSNGWNVSQIEVEKARVLSIWNQQYKYRWQADSFFQAGKLLNTNRAYAEAILAFENAIQSEEKNAMPDKDWIRAYIRWIAFSYYKNKDYRNALENYKRAYKISKVELKNSDYEILDLQDMGNIYDWLGEYANKEVCRQLGASLQRKINEKNQSNRLIIVAAGAPDNSKNPFVSCQKDAIKITEILTEKGKLIYDTVFRFVLVGKDFSKAGMNETFKKVLAIARPGDALIYYFSGNTYSSADDKGFLLGNDSLLVQELQYWSTNILSRKQLFIWDIPNAGHTDAFLALKNTQSLEGKATQTDLILLANKGTRIESEGAGGLLSAAVIEALQGKANTGFSDNDRSVSAKELEAYVFDKLGRNNYYLQVTTFSEGLDFPLVSAPLMSGLADNKGPKLTLNFQSSSALMNRGVDIENEEETAVLTGQAIDEGGILEVTVNDHSVSLATNGKFSYVVTEPENSYLHIRARDNSGNITSDSIKVSRVSHESREVKREVVNRALLFGTDIYDEWSSLNNPISDVLAIGKILEEYYGYEVTIVKNATQYEVREKLDSFLRLSYGPHDQLIVFFAGHGMLDSIYGGHIVCKDSRKTDKTRQTYYPFHQLAGSLNGVQNCRHILLVLDVCFGGQIFSKQIAPAYLGQDIYSVNKENIKLQKILASKSRMYITSGGETYVPDGRPGHHSPFASRFIQALEYPLKDSQKSFITLKDIVDFLRDLPENQEPRYGSFGNESEFDKNADIALQPLIRYGGIAKNVSTTSPGFKK